MDAAHRRSLAISGPPLSRGDAARRYGGVLPKPRSQQQWRSDGRQQLDQQQQQQQQQQRQQQQQLQPFKALVLRKRGARGEPGCFDIGGEEEEDRHERPRQRPRHEADAPQLARRLRDVSSPASGRHLYPDLVRCTVKVQLDTSEPASKPRVLARPLVLPGYAASVEQAVVQAVRLRAEGAAQLISRRAMTLESHDDPMEIEEDSARDAQPHTLPRDQHLFASPPPPQPPQRHSSPRERKPLRLAFRFPQPHSGAMPTPSAPAPPSPPAPAAATVSTAAAAAIASAAAAATSSSSSRMGSTASTPGAGDKTQSRPAGGEATPEAKSESKAAEAAEAETQQAQQTKQAVALKEEDEEDEEDKPAEGGAAGETTAAVTQGERRAVELIVVSDSDSENEDEVASPEVASPTAAPATTTASASKRKRPVTAEELDVTATKTKSCEAATPAIATPTLPAAPDAAPSVVATLSSPRESPSKIWRQSTPPSKSLAAEANPAAPDEQADERADKRPRETASVEVQTAAAPRTSEAAAQTDLPAEPALDGSAEASGGEREEEESKLREEVESYRVAMSRLEDDLTALRLEREQAIAAAAEAAANAAQRERALAVAGERHRAEVEQLRLRVEDLGTQAEAARERQRAAARRAADMEKAAKREKGSREKLKHVAERMSNQLAGAENEAYRLQSQLQDESLKRHELEGQSSAIRAAVRGAWAQTAQWEAQVGVMLDRLDGALASIEHKRRRVQLVLRKQRSLAARQQPAVAQVCIVCVSKPNSVCFVPCGHRSVCPGCDQGMTHCPVCRTFIRERVRTFDAGL